MRTDRLAKSLTLGGVSVHVTEQVPAVRVPDVNTLVVPRRQFRRSERRDDFVLSQALTLPKGVPVHYGTKKPAGLATVVYQVLLTHEQQHMFNQRVRKACQRKRLKGFHWLVRVWGRE